MRLDSKQDVIDENETVLVELDDGARLIEIVDPDSYQDRFSYRVETPYNEPLDFGDDERRAKLTIALYERVSGFSRPQSVDPAIPLPVVKEGSAAVATYLYAVRGWESDSVAEALDLARRSVWDYISDVRRSVESLQDT